MADFTGNTVAGIYVEARVATTKAGRDLQRFLADAEKALRAINPEINIDFGGDAQKALEALRAAYSQLDDDTRKVVDSMAAQSARLADEWTRNEQRRIEAGRKAAAELEATANKAAAAIAAANEKATERANRGLAEFQRRRAADAAKEQADNDRRIEQANRGISDALRRREVEEARAAAKRDADGEQRVERANRGISDALRRRAEAEDQAAAKAQAENERRVERANRGISDGLRKRAEEENRAAAKAQADEERAAAKRQADNDKRVETANRAISDALRKRAAEEDKAAAKAQADNDRRVEQANRGISDAVRRRAAEEDKAAAKAQADNLKRVEQANRAISDALRKRAAEADRVAAKEQADNDKRVERANQAIAAAARKRAAEEERVAARAQADNVKRVEAANRGIADALRKRAEDAERVAAREEAANAKRIERANAALAAYQRRLEESRRVQGALGGTAPAVTDASTGPVRGGTLSQVYADLSVRTDRADRQISTFVADAEKILANVRGEVRVDLKGDPKRALAELEKDFDRLPPAAQRVVASLRQVDAAADKVDAGARRSADGFDQLRNALAGVVTVRLAGSALTRSVAEFTNIGETANALQAQLGNAARGVEQWATTTDTSFGLAQGAAQEYVAQYSAIFQVAQVGFERTAQAQELSLQQQEKFAEQNNRIAAQQGKNLVQLASDVASLRNKSIEEVNIAFRALLAGEAEPARRLGVFINEYAVEQQILLDRQQKGIQSTSKTFSDAEKIQARYELLLKQTTAAQGDFAKTFTTLPNQLRILQAELRTLSSNFGEGLFDAASDSVAQLRGGIALATDNAIPMGRTIGAAAQGITTPLFGAAQAAEGLALVLGQLPTAATQLGTAFASTAVALNRFGPDGLSFFGNFTRQIEVDGKIQQESLSGTAAAMGAFRQAATEAAEGGGGAIRRNMAGAAAALGTVNLAAVGATATLVGLGLIMQARAEDAARVKNETTAAADAIANFDVVGQRAADGASRFIARLAQGSKGGIIGDDDLERLNEAGVSLREFYDLAARGRGGSTDAADELITKLGGVRRLYEELETQFQPGDLDRFDIRGLDPEDAEDAEKIREVLRNIASDAKSLEAVELGKKGPLKDLRELGKEIDQSAEGFDKAAKNRVEYLQSTGTLTEASVKQAKAEAEKNGETEDYVKILERATELTAKQTGVTLDYANNSVAAKIALAELGKTEDARTRRLEGLASLQGLVLDGLMEAANGVLSDDVVSDIAGRTGVGVEEIIKAEERLQEAAQDAGMSTRELARLLDATGSSAEDAARALNQLRPAVEVPTGSVERVRDAILSGADAAKAAENATRGWAGAFPEVIAQAVEAANAVRRNVSGLLPTFGGAVTQATTDLNKQIKDNAEETAGDTTEARRAIERAFKAEEDAIRAAADAQQDALDAELEALKERYRLLKDIGDESAGDFNFNLRLRRLEEEAERAEREAERAIKDEKDRLRDEEDAQLDASRERRQAALDALSDAAKATKASFEELRTEVTATIGDTISTLNTQIDNVRLIISQAARLKRGGNLSLAATLFGPDSTLSAEQKAAAARELSQLADDAIANYEAQFDEALLELDALQKEGENVLTVTIRAALDQEAAKAAAEQLETTMRAAWAQGGLFYPDEETGQTEIRIKVDTAIPLEMPAPTGVPRSSADEIDGWARQAQVSQRIATANAGTERSFRALVQQATATATALAKAGKIGEDWQSIQQTTVAILRDAAAAYPELTDEVDDYVDTVNTIPPDKITTADLDTVGARAALDSYNIVLEQVPAAVDTTVTAQIVGDDVERLATVLAGVAGNWSVKVNADTREAEVALERLAALRASANFTQQQIADLNLLMQIFQIGQGEAARLVLSGESTSLLQGIRLASGGVFDRPTQAVIGEEPGNPEVVLPLGSGRRQRAADLLVQAGVFTRDGRPTEVGADILGRLGAASQARAANQERMTLDGGTLGGEVSSGLQVAAAAVSSNTSNFATNTNSYTDRSIVAPNVSVVIERGAIVVQGAEEPLITADVITRAVGDSIGRKLAGVVAG